MLPETQKVVQPMVDGLRAKGFIIRQHSVAMGWSADLTIAPHLHCRRTDADLAASAADWLPIFTGMSIQWLYGP